MKCLTGIKYNMKASIIDFAPRADAVDAAITGGHFEVIQDEETGGVKRIWVEDTAVAPAFNAARPVSIPRFEIPCYARGFTELGFRSTANTQSFEDGVYRAVEVIQMTYPSRYNLTRSQYVTNIRDRWSNVLWLEEELGEPTIFEVQGVTPIFDPFGRHVDNLAVLRRAVNQ